MADKKIYKAYKNCFYDFVINKIIGQGDDGIVVDVKVKNKRLLHMHPNFEELSKKKSFALKIMSEDEEYLKKTFGSTFESIKNISREMGDLDIGPKVIDTFICYEKNTNKSLFILMDKIDGTLYDYDTFLKMNDRQLFDYFHMLYNKIYRMNDYIVHNDLDYCNIGYKIIGDQNTYNYSVIPYILDYAWSNYGTKTPENKIHNEYAKRVKEFEILRMSFILIRNTLQSLVRNEHIQKLDVEKDIRVVDVPNVKLDINGLIYRVNQNIIYKNKTLIKIIHKNDLDEYKKAYEYIKKNYKKNYLNIEKKIKYGNLYIMVFKEKQMITASFLKYEDKYRSIRKMFEKKYDITIDFFKDNNKNIYFA